MRRWIGIVAALIVSMLMTGSPAMGKQNVAVEVFYNSVWNDHTADLYRRNPITINRAAGSEQTGVVPTDGTIVFQGRDGRMNPDNVKSPLYGLIGEKTPIRVKVDGDIRLSGRAVKWSPRRSLGGQKFDAWIVVTIAGKVRELGQGEQPRRSAMYRAYGASGPIAWWPLEDPSDARQAASGVNGVAPLALSGSGLTRFAGLPGPAGAASAADTSATGTSADVMEGSIPIGSGTSWRVEFSMMYRTSDVTYNVGMSGWSTLGDVSDWYLDINEAGTGLRLFYIDSAGIQTAGTAPSVERNDGLWHLYTITGTQSGADINITVKIDNVTVLTATVAGHAFGVPSKIFGQASIFSADPVATGMSHIAVWVPASAVDTLPAFNGHAWETAGARFTRICQESGIVSTIVGIEAETQMMGPQPAETTLKILDEVARTDEGIIFDTRSQEGLTLRTGRSLHNQ